MLLLNLKGVDRAKVRAGIHWASSPFDPVCSVAADSDSSVACLADFTLNFAVFRVLHQLRALL